MRLIDANALKEDFMNDYNNYMMESLRGNHHDVIRISEVIERIEDAPTIEAEPVKYAHRTLNIGLRSYCSNCGVLAYCENFCSNCGAYIIKEGDSE